jgi:4a-hydroxytetrahydrobiopterin dehydratase
MLRGYMTSLARQHCEACTPRTPTLQPAEVAELQAELSADWVVEGTERLRRSIRYANFASTFTAATHVALIAEAEGHHPELRLGWGHLDIELTTHAAGGLTRNDFILAARIDSALG